MGGKIRGLGSTDGYGAWVTAGICERDEPGFSMVGVVVGWLRRKMRNVEIRWWEDEVGLLQD
jgi:hypothetical protein